MTIAAHHPLNQTLRKPIHAHDLYVLNLNRIGVRVSSVDLEFVAIFLQEARDVLADWERHCLDLEKEFTQSKIDALFRAAHNLKGSARSVGLEAFASFIHRAEDLITGVRSGSFSFSAPVAQNLLAAQSLLLQWLDQLVVDVSFVPMDQVEPLTQSLTALATATPSTQNKSTEPSAADKDQAFMGFFDDEPTETPAPVPAETRKEPAPVAVAKKTESKPVAKTSLETIRVLASKIDALLQLSGEIATQQAIIAHALKTNALQQPGSRNAIQIVTKLTKELQTQTMSLRMQDLSSLFQRLERAAIDVSRTVGKSIQVVLSGNDVELDKTVIERIVDPLVHLVRNAVDHGIEDGESRIAAGKPKEGRIRIEAKLVANGASLQISDDGKGIDAQKILAKAIAKGLISEAEAKETKRPFDMIFLPGFSTAEKVTEVSGRGVGLDVVRRAVEELGGTLDLSSELGNGSTFNITLPTNLSIIDALVVAVEGEAYVVPVLEVAEVIDIASFEAVSLSNRSNVVRLRERTVPIKKLAAYLSATGKAKTRAPETIEEKKQAVRSPALVIDFSGRQVAFTFDGILGKQSVVVRKLAGKLQTLPGFIGSTILPSGEPAMILSPREFAKQYFGKAEAA